MRIIIFWLLITGAAGFGPWIGEAPAGVMIKVRAVNPLDREAVASIRYPLPKAVTPDDVLGKRVAYSGRRKAAKATDGAFPVDDPGEGRIENGGREDPAVRRGPLSGDFKISFDGEKGEYYIDHEILLAPKEVVTLEVDVRDVWVVEEKKIEALRKEVNAAYSAERIADSGGEDLTAERYMLYTELKDEISGALDQIIERQARHTIDKVGVEMHIRAYEQNMETLQQAQADIGMLENLLSANE